ncbi:MAG: PQQ-binding-like beta-propeller repeat protein [Candidatus Stahlbacteria bacterium]|nr:PQQ-binding-like beta-propeller repeat protein [Candidatus Stahlbacteria bacterium]
MRCNFLKSALIIGIVSVSVDVFADIDYWLMFRHDPQRTGRSPYPGTEVCDLKWKYDVSATPAYFHSSPVVKGLDSSPDPLHNPMLYLGNMHKTRVYAFKDYMFFTDTVWTYKPNGSTSYFHSSPAVGAIGTDGAIYIGSEDGNVYALRQDGSVKWIFPTQGAVFSSPVLSASGVVYIGSNDSSVYAINSTTGVQVWKCDLPIGVLSSPALSLDESVVYVASGSEEWFTDDKARLYAISAVTGGINWEFDSATSKYCSPSVGTDGTIYIGSKSNNDSKLYAVNPDGTQKWVSTVDGGTSSAAISADGSTVYTACGRINAINTSDGSIKWSKFWGSGMVDSHYGGPILSSNNRLYFGVGFNNYGRVYNLNATTGAIDCYYDTEPGEEVWDTPAIGPDKTVYFGDCSGHTFYAIWDRTAGVEEEGLRDKGLKVSPTLFSKSTTIRYYVENENNVNIRIYDMAGNCVSELVNARQSVGNYTISWNSKDTKDKRVSNGVYFCKAKIGNRNIVQKLLLVTL